MKIVDVIWWKPASTYPISACEALVALVNSVNKKICIYLTSVPAPWLTQPYNHIIYPGVAKIYLVFFWKCLLYLLILLFSRVTDRVRVSLLNPGLFVPLHFRFRERKVHRENFCSHGTFVPWNIRSSRHSFAVRTVGDWNLLMSHVWKFGTVNPSILQGGAVQVDVGCICTVKRHPQFMRYSTRRTVDYLSESESEYRQLPIDHCFAWPTIYV